jgi:hypothetical protein
MKTLQTIILVAALLAAGRFVSGSTTSAPSPTQNIDRTEPPQVKADDASSWELVWDDKIDDSLDRQAKVCRLRLAFRNGKVKGHFDGLVLGRPREARFVGKLIPSDSTSLLIMEQREKDYTCVYQIQAVGGGYFGVWRDTRGGKGDVELHHASSDATTLSRQ